MLGDTLMNVMDNRIVEPTPSFKVISDLAAQYRPVASRNNGRLYALNRSIKHIKGGDHPFHSRAQHPFSVF